MRTGIALLERIVALDADKHIAKNMSKEEIIRNVRFEQYRDVRPYDRMNLFISSDHHLLTTGKPENAYP